ncbi:MAG: PRC-barrel domain-containing protein [Nitrospinae bacterium]|jgi:hypothetical protein|nr:PRC-barrel domain-containing protein [Nitrospinota bacterium]MDA1110095.1 PRC-barrel domain-containing protein [Nitrospinota bacterium]
MSIHRLTYISENIYKLREQDRIIGCYLYDEFDDALSRIEALVVESGTLLARYAVVTLGGMLNIKGKTLLLPIEVCRSIDLGKVRTAWRKESLMDAPTPHNPQQVTIAEEELILGYFDLKPYWAVEPEPPEEKPGDKNSDPKSRKPGY